MAAAAPLRQGPRTREQTQPARAHAPARLDGYFKITERGSTVGREVRGGVVTFFTMAYIVVLNPLILGFAPDADGKFLGGGAAEPRRRSPPATALVGRRDDDPDGRRRQLPARAGHRARAERLRRLRASPAR